MREEQATCSTAERTAVCWTGGKDCHLALLDAWRDPTLEVTDLVVFQPENKPSHAHPFTLQEAQARALGLPLHHFIMTKPYKDAYVKAIQSLRNNHDIRVICTGDMDLVGDMKTNWIQDCAEAATGVRAVMPLWNASRASCLETLHKENFTVIFSCVKSPWFDESWCGKKLDRKTLEEMKQLATQDFSKNDNHDSQDPRRQPFDLGGEQGEYHTMCLDGPPYQYPIEIGICRPKQFVSEPSDEPRWWTYNGQKWWTLGEFEIKTPGCGPKCS